LGIAQRYNRKNLAIWITIKAMSKDSIFRQTYNALRTPLDEEQRAELNSSRPFFVIVLLVLGSFSIWLILLDPNLQQPRRLIPFILVMVLYLAMQWSFQRLIFSPSLILPWIVLQMILAAILVLISRSEALILALILPLMGEMLGFFRDRLLYAALGILALLGLAISLMVYLTDWEIRTFLFTVFPLMAFVITFVTLFMREAEARRAAQESAKELQEANRQVIQYASKAEEMAMATERERLARELHDTLSQGLSGLVLQLDAAHAHLKSGSAERAEEILLDAINRAREALRESRRAISDLRTSTAEEQDLESRLLREVTRFTMTTGIPCDFEYDLPGEPPTASADHLLRIVSEGLSNIARHAQAEHARMSFLQAEQSMVVFIIDDGIGFDTAGEPPKGGHFGIIGMRERARLMGGSLALTSSPGEGTRLRLEIPLETQ
jgi:NarL family two-component system sensor histidine kinase YdfH